jgi:uncharacterized membrane protein YgcG
VRKEEGRPDRMSNSFTHPLDRVRFSLFSYCAGVNIRMWKSRTMSMLRWEGVYAEAQRVMNAVLVLVFTRLNNVTPAGGDDDGGGDDGDDGDEGGGGGCRWPKPSRNK